MSNQDDKGHQVPDTNGFIFKMHADQISRQPKSKFYWEIIKRRTELINSAVKKS